MNNIDKEINIFLFRKLFTVNKKTSKYEECRILYKKFPNKSYFSRDHTKKKIVSQVIYEISETCFSCTKLHYMKMK